MIQLGIVCVWWVGWGGWLTPITFIQRAGAGSKIEILYLKHFNYSYCLVYGYLEAWIILFSL